MKIALLHLGDNGGGYFNSLTYEEKIKIYKCTIRWSLKWLDEKDIFDKIFLFIWKSEYEFIHGTEFEYCDNSKIKIIPFFKGWFTLTNDELLFGSLKDLVNDDDWIFSTHLDSYFSRDFLNKYLEESKTRSYIAKNLDPGILRVDGKIVPWYYDVGIFAKVGFLRQHNLKFGWGPLKKDYDDLERLAKESKLEAKYNILKRDLDLEMDGSMTTSLKLFLKMRNGEIPNDQVLDMGDENFTKDYLHFENFYQHLHVPIRSKGCGYNLLLRFLCLGQNTLSDQEKDDVNFLKTAQGIDNYIRKCFPLVKQSIFYQKIINDYERSQWDLLMNLTGLDKK